PAPPRFLGLAGHILETAVHHRFERVKPLLRSLLWPGSALRPVPAPSILRAWCSPATLRPALRAWLPAVRPGSRSARPAPWLSLPLMRVSGSCLLHPVVAAAAVARSP